MYLTEIVTHRAGYTQKMSPASSSFSQRLVLCILYSRPCFHEAAPVCRDQCEAALGLLPAHGHHPAAPTLLPAATRLCAHRSSHLQIKQGSPPPRAPQLALPSRSPFQEAFFSCRRKASLAGFLLTNPGVRESNPGVHLAPCSLPLPGSSQPIRTKPVIFCHKRGGDSSMW